MPTRSANSEFHYTCELTGIEGKKPLFAAIDELPEAGRKSLMQQVEWNRDRFD